MLSAQPKPPRNTSNKTPSKRKAVKVSRPATSRSRKTNPLKNLKQALKRRWKKWWSHHGQPRRLVKYGFLGAFWMSILMLVMALYIFANLPDIDQVVDMDSRPTVIILDKNDKEVARLGDTQGQILSVKNMSPYMTQAVLAIEDRRFYSHFGLDPLGLARAMWVNATSGGVSQGGSTITQQLAKNLFLSPERTFSRKVKEAALAFYLEYKYSKDEILSAYLNRVYFGAGAYGVDAAARIYFNSNAKNLTIDQAALLAGLLKAPSRYSPDSDPQRAATRARTVIYAMADAGYITKKKADSIKIQPLPKKDYSAAGSMDMRYFTDWVVSQSAGYIGETSQNLVIRTTLDSDLQKYAAKHLRDVLAKEGKDLKISQGAIITMKMDGAISAMVGGTDYRTSQFNRTTQARRQPGSAFKPFIYLTAMEQAGYTPDSWIEDAPIQINGYKPANFDNKYRGGMSLQTSLAHSINTVAVRLLHETGIGPARRTAQRLGITDPLNADLSLALGTSGVRLINLTSAFATFGNNGRAVEPYGIRDIRDTKGKKLYEHVIFDPAPLVDSYYVGMMNRMLQAVVQYGTGTRARLDRAAAGKSGTSQNYRDALFVGYTADMATAVWVGNDDNKPMAKVTGGTMPARLWHDVMMQAHQGLAQRDFGGGYNDGLPPSRDPMVAPQNNGAAPANPFNDMLNNLFKGDGQWQHDNNEYLNN
jgi:penicillin-binding protein 1A